MKKYIMWIAVALLVAAGSFFVYKKMRGTDPLYVPGARVQMIGGGR